MTTDGQVSAQDRPGSPPVGPIAATWHTVNAARYNLRDYGGYSVRGGGRLRSGALFRSGQLDAAGAPEAGLLQRLGIGAIVDLRGPAELGEGMSCAFDGFSGKVLFASAEDNLVPHSMEHLVGVQSADEVAAQMTRVYRKLPYSGRFREALTNYFDALEGAGEHAGPATLIHCFAGKDRTGIAVALFHHVAGVHRDDSYADYLATNDMGEERIAHGLPHLSRRSGGRAEEWILREVMKVRAAYLDAMFDAVTTRSGDPLTFLAEATGRTPAQVTAIAERWVD
ncbi:MAG: tyrosine-protein phosphatase [Pseudomonadota bacterium]